MIIKSQIWVAKYFTQGKCEEAVSEENLLFQNSQNTTSSQEDADNQYCFTAKALKVTYSGKWINPNHPFKCSQILQVVKAKAEMFWWNIPFLYVLTHRAVSTGFWMSPVTLFLVLKGRDLLSLQEGFISPGVRSPQGKCLYLS